MTPQDILALMRRRFEGRPFQMVTMEALVDSYPKWAADIVRDLGERDPAREVVWL